MSSSASERSDGCRNVTPISEARSNRDSEQGQQSQARSHPNPPEGWRGRSMICEREPERRSGR